MITIQDLLKEQADLENKLNAVKLMIQAYRNEVNAIIEEVSPTFKSESSLNNNIMENGTWIQQIWHVIEEKNRFMHNNELAIILKPYHTDKDFDKVKKRISTVLTHAKTNKTIINLTNYRFSKSIKDTVWGKREWIGENGIIKNENMYYEKSDI